MSSSPQRLLCNMQKVETPPQTAAKSGGSSASAARIFVLMSSSQPVMSAWVLVGKSSWVRLLLGALAPALPRRRLCLAPMGATGATATGAAVLAARLSLARLGRCTTPPPALAEAGAGAARRDIAAPGV